MTFRTRFAPSPTGPLHLGHAFSAITAFDMIRCLGGEFLLRMDDLDQSRSSPRWESAIMADLSWLGLEWEGPVVRQSDRNARYQEALNSLWKRGLLYICRCTRKDIAKAASAPQQSSGVSSHGIVYPGTCRPPSRHHVPGYLPEQPRGAALRLNLKAVADTMGRQCPGFVETGPTAGGKERAIACNIADLYRRTGDVVLGRLGASAAYHLAVVLDDADQRITHVCRGKDLLEFTPLHCLLQHLLSLPVPTYHHHRLMVDDRGRRLAKRDKARALATLRSEGKTPIDIRAMVRIPAATS